MWSFKHPTLYLHLLIVTCMSVYQLPTVLGADVVMREEAFIGYTEKALSASGTVKVTTEFGQLLIKLRPDLAPETCRLVAELAKRAECPQCTFYRHEPVSENWGINNFWGPPYALLQGGLHDMSDTPPFENTKKAVAKKGAACMIPGSKDFFIATADHDEWGNAHTVFGQVDDLTTASKVPFEPYHNYTDGGGITTRWLNSTYKFTLEYLP